MLKHTRASARTHTHMLFFLPLFFFFFSVFQSSLSWLQTQDSAAKKEKKEVTQDKSQIYSHLLCTFPNLKPA